MDETYLDAADAEARESILSEMCRCWGGGMSIDTYRSYLDEVDNHPWARRRVRTLLLRNASGDLLSSLTLHAVPALHHGKELLLAGIARVLTPEELRGRGFAGAMMRATIRLLKEEGIDGAYLYSDIDPRFYEPFGFETVSRSMTTALLDDLPDSFDAEAVRILQADDWQAVWQIYADAGRSEPLWFAREPEHWDYLLSRSLAFGRHSPGSETAALDLVLLDEGEVAGYLIARVRGDEVDLLEVGMADPEPAKFDVLLAALRAEGEKRGCRRLLAPWPPGRWRDLFGSRLTVTERSEGIFMLAPLGRKVDLISIQERCGGSWETDRI